MNSNIQLCSFFAITSLFTASGCGLISKTFEGDVAIEFSVDSEGDSYSNIETVDPNENEDVRENRDHIKETTVREIVFSVESIHETNRALMGSGEIYVRKLGGEWDAEPIATFEETPVQVGQTKTLAITPEQVNRVEELLKDVFEVRIDGRVDQGPLAFDGKLTFDLEIRAGL